MTAVHLQMAMIASALILIGFLAGQFCKDRRLLLLWKGADARSNSWFELYLNSLREIERLKRGEFTEEEFQNLCHNFSEDDACRFRAGCEEYQRKLFGADVPPEVRERQTYLEDAVMRLTRWLQENAHTQQALFVADLSAVLNLVGEKSE